MQVRPLILSPQGAHQNLGIAGWAPFFRDAKTAFTAFASRLPESGGSRQHGHLLPVGAFRHRVARGPLLLTGDAAGLLNLASGEGIGYAIVSGQLATDSIVDALGASHEYPDAGERYACRIRESIAPELRAATFIAGLVLATRRLHFALEPADADAVFLRLFAAVGGTATYVDLARFVYSHLPRYVAKWAWRSVGPRRGAQGGLGAVTRDPCP